MAFDELVPQLSMVALIAIILIVVYFLAQGT